MIMPNPTSDAKSQQTADVLARECPRLNVTMLPKSMSHNVPRFPSCEQHIEVLDIP